jgi:hypothetical protein
MTEQEKNNKNRLEEVRRNAPADLEKKINTVRDFSRMVKEIKEKAKKDKLTISLIKYVNPFLDWAFGVALSLAILKDISDFIGLGSLPVIGTLITFFVSTMIFFCTLITGSQAESEFVRRWMRKLITIGVGTLIEFVFGIDFLPIETLIVVAVYLLILHERYEDSQEKKAESIQKEMQESYA